MTLDIVTKPWGAQIFAKKIRLGILSRWMVAFEYQPDILERRCEEQSAMYDAEDQILESVTDWYQLE